MKNPKIHENEYQSKDEAKSVKSVTNYRNPAFWVLVAFVIACVTVAVCFLTNPKEEADEIKLTDID